MISTVMACWLTMASGQVQIYALNADLPVWDVAVSDVNLDGHKDIFALCSDPESRPFRKELCAFLADASGAYSSAPSLVMKLGADMGAAFFAETDGAPPQELVITDSKGATIHAFKNGGFQPLKRVDFDSLLPGGVKKPVFLDNAAIHLDGDAMEEWMLPVSSGYAVRMSSGEIVNVDCDVISEIKGDEGQTITHRMPVFQAFPVAGESRKGLAFLSNEFTEFAYGPNWSKHERMRIPSDLEDKSNKNTQMADINGDGFPDLLITQTTGRVNIKVKTQVYIATAPFKYPEKPTSFFETSGVLTAPVLQDVNGDGMRDLIFAKIPLGVKLFVNYLVSQRLTVQVEVHLFKDGGFAKSADYHSTVTVDAPEGRERVAFTMADFNGDGRSDVAFGSGGTEIIIHTGEENRFMSSKPTYRLALPSYGEARPYDLNGNGSDDIVLFHTSGADQKRIEVAVF